MPRPDILLLVAMSILLALWSPGDCMEFSECTKPCWVSYNRCRANNQLAACNPPMATCMDKCVALKDAVERHLRDDDGGWDWDAPRKASDGWDDWGPSLPFRF